MLHVEVPIRRKDPLDQFLWNWDTTNNNEPFWSTLAELDLVEPAVRAGFPRESIFEAEMPSLSRQGGIWLGYGARQARSEEHTSEPQSLMRIPYAVFCLNNKKSLKRQHQ